MIKDNQTLLNRIHVVVDALVIACTYIAAWFIQFEFFAPDVAGKLPLEDIVFNYRAYGLPCFETIRRARQRVQSLFPEYSRNPQKEEQSGSISIVINIS